MRPGTSYRPLVLAIALLALPFAAGCDPSSGPASAVPGSQEPLAYAVCAPSEDVEPATTDMAIEVLRSRLAWLEVAGTAVATGSCIEVAVPAPDAAVAAAIEGTGAVRLLALPADRLGEAVVGEGVPPDAPVLATAGDFPGSGTRPAANGTTELVVRLSPAGARSVEAFTSASLGGALVLDVDGVVVAVAPVDGPIRGPEVVLPLAGSPPLPIRAVLAMLASGPLPEAWTQPRNPQG